MSPAPALPDPGPANPPAAGRDLLVVGMYALLVLVLAASGVANSGFLVQDGAWPPEVSVALMLAACLSLLWRRRRPAVVLAMAGPLSLVEIVAGGQISAYFLLFEALFVPVMHGSRRLARATTWIASAVGALAVLAGLLARAPGEVVFVIVLISALLISTPLLWGWEVRHHRDARRSAEHLAGLEHELATTRAAHAVETERRSIAHDLHDVIAGHLSAVSLHTSLAASLEDRPARDASLTTARESAHAALRDLRSMIGVLSTEEAGTLPSATLDWPSLTSRLRGRDPEARVSIDPALHDPGQVDPAVQAALLRIGAEAVTNAVRHGRAPLSMEAAVEAAEVRFALRNHRGSPRAVGTGMGRGAIAHRAAAVGGSASSGPAPASADGAAADTWEVLAQLPLQVDRGISRPGPDRLAEEPRS
ncbi:histidine kinase [Brachybacterium avium]|uniref:histidine kinase n=1 Tax=Brachybacterium avium TaxID=2017485 RepID=A0A220UDT3_9MICO|nr:histidine kinase [Brachybacterium avium]ASK66255.1 histidine kinase [Brachybacterium avium]